MRFLQAARSFKNRLSVRHYVCACLQIVLGVACRCKQFYYCSPECQRTHWRASHKHHCRAPDSLRVGDYVRITGALGGELAQLRPHFFVLSACNAAGEWELRNDTLGSFEPRVVPAASLRRVVVN